MTSTTTSIAQLFLLPILLLFRIELINGFVGGAGLSSPHVSSLSYGVDRCHDADAEIEVHDEHRTSYLPNRDRRSFLSHLALSSLSVGSPLVFSAQNANALPFGLGGPNRRQLELCLVTILRTEYWAMSVSKSLKTGLLSPIITDTSNPRPEMPENQRKQPYLQARLGAKALLTQKIGGGANSRVEELGGFQLKECLEDAKYWCGDLAKSNQLPGEMSTKNAKRICSNDLLTAAEDLVESLGSLVEFDGLETTVDPSPRSSLMLSMYNDQKGTFVYRTLVERVIPSCESILMIFGRERRSLVEEYVKSEYGSEIPFEILERMYDSEQQ